MGVYYEMRKSQLQWFWCKWLVESFQPQVRFPGSPILSLCMCWCWEPGSCQVSGRDRLSPGACGASRTLITCSTVQALLLLSRAAAARAYMECQHPAHSTNAVTDTHIWTGRIRALAAWSHAAFSCPLQICVWYKTHIKVMCKFTCWYCNASLFLMPLYLLMMCLVESC